MPTKYHIHTEPASPRFRPVGRLGIVDWREDCSSCHNCVKRSCVYEFYRDEADTLRNQTGYLDYIYQCKGCLNCVQDCTKGILTRVVNPEYERLGDEHYTPAIILSTWYQAEMGRIPVSGAGYGGPFSGSGFDSMWRISVRSSFRMSRGRWTRQLSAEKPDPKSSRAKRTPMDRS